MLADRDRRANVPVQQTVTDTVTPEAPGGLPPAAPSGWTPPVIPGMQIGEIRFTAVHRTALPATPVADEVPR
ncbi:MAG: hypothetical protein NT146_02760 [Mycobacterium sp.]|nr:hypothetical protein [Mycobacterium sp.]